MTDWWDTPKDRHYLHDDPYPERTRPPSAEPKYFYGLERLMYRPWQSTWWQRLLARFVGVRL